MPDLKLQRGAERLHEPFCRDQQSDGGRTGGDAVQADPEAQECIGLGKSGTQYRGVR
ncbi:Uncharacterised protein [Mycobacteroides abscessus subsp. abscessus]|nr:Uncharacterised protein [Mycobacteroides abscessus subsp. abscessus]